MGREVMARAHTKTDGGAITVTPVTRADVDLADTSGLAAFLEAAEFDAVINAAAYNAVDRAEIEPDLVHAVNATAPQVMAAACAKRAAGLVHVSSDYVFDGRAQAPYREADAPGPLSVYGRSKRAGEMAVADAHPGAWIVRTAWVYSRRPGNFASRLLAHVQSRAPGAASLKGVTDQWSSPTFAGDLAQAALMLIGRRGGGLLHVAGSGAASRLEFMQAILEASGCDTAIEPVSADSFAASATRSGQVQAVRPRYTPLNSDRAQALGLPVRDWREGVRAAFCDTPASS